MNHNYVIDQEIDICFRLSFDVWRYIILERQAAQSQVMPRDFFQVVCYTHIDDLPLPKKSIKRIQGEFNFSLADDCLLIASPKALIFLNHVSYIYFNGKCLFCHEIGGIEVSNMHFIDFMVISQCSCLCGLNNVSEDSISGCYILKGDGI
ncbi:hypothetical protein QVD17_18680 [Tagetes erecta]|uniref:Uncharacterized protein n=1 Tax=Tagetes erecta TaxID=13708 RepID=A0AAD8NVY4_TARER|nr:hypothetical protein QVD17_18680 [Tagetes erecta]